MPALKAGASKTAKRSMMKHEMDKWKSGTMHSGSEKGPIVHDQKQAIAIGLSMSGQSKRSKRKAARKGARGGGRR